MGRMFPAGMREIERAPELKTVVGRPLYAPQKHGRGSRRPQGGHYRGNKKASKFFEALDGANRYAILYRVHNAKKPETRAARIEKFVTMLAASETIHPQKPKKPS